MINGTSNDQGVKGGIRIVGSIIVALSGLMLFSDKVLTIELTNNFGFKNTSTFLWVLTQSLSPFLLVLASVFKPYRISYTIPVYFYTIQLYWVFDPSLKMDDALLHLYAFGSVLGFLLLSYVIIRINDLKTRKQLMDEEFKKETKEVIKLLKSEILQKEVI